MDITDAGPRLRQMNDALAEIERLRLTDEEREAIEAAVRIINSYEEDMDGFPSGAAATLRGLLERHFPAPENQPSQDNTPPAWMARPCWVDPPEGWRYGFPRLYDPAKDGDMKAWLVANGYPQYLADQNLPCTFTAQTDSH